MEPTLTHIVDELAATQAGMLILGAVVLILGGIWLALQFGLIKPKNGNSVHSVTTELKTMNTELKDMGKDMGLLVSLLPQHMADISKELEKLNSEQTKTKEGVQRLVDFDDFKRASGK